MNDYIKREDAIGALDGWFKLNGMPELGVGVLYLVPSADVVSIADIHDAGYQGKEVRFRIGGRLFVVRELPQ